jgi:hypothetical protein
VTGKIENVVIGWSPDGKRSVAIDLETLRRHCRPERVEDLLDDLQILCEDVQGAPAVRRARPGCPQRLASDQGG